MFVINSDFWQGWNSIHAELLREVKSTKKSCSYSRTVQRHIEKRKHHIQLLQSRPKVVGTLELYHISPFPEINVGKYRGFFFNKKGKNHLIINIDSGGRGELFCPGLSERRI